MATGNGIELEGNTMRIPGFYFAEALMRGRRMDVFHCCFFLVGDEQHNV